MMGQIAEYEREPPLGLTQRAVQLVRLSILGRTMLR